MTPQLFKQLSQLAVISATLVLAACGGSSGGSQQTTPLPPPPPPPAAPVTFHCGDETQCPRLTFAGDPEADSATHFFRGFGDPSIESDPVTGDVWLSYSWLSTAVSDPGPPEQRDRQITSHLARSTDGGASFTFVRAANAVQQIAHPGNAELGWSQHEVTTLVKRPTNDWELLFLTYFDPLGDTAPDHRDFYYARSIATDPNDLGDTVEAWARGSNTAQDFSVAHDLGAEIPELADCAVLTEPMLFAYNSETYFATNCIPADASGNRDIANERIVLLKEAIPSYQYIGDITDAQDAIDLGVDRLEQGDIALAQDGSVLLIVTPISDTKPVEHEGCVVFEFDNFESASLVRDASGVAIPRTILTADATGTGPGSGPGLCTYDANSSTGVLMVTKLWQTTPFSLEFVLRQTGVHP